MSSNPDVITEQTVPSAPSETRSFVLYDVLEALGKRSFVPFIAVPALLGLTPFGTSITFAAILGLVFAWVGVQLLIGRTFPALPSRIAYKRFDNRLAQYFTAWLLEAKLWLDEATVPRLSWLTTSVFASLPYLMLIVTGVALPILVMMDQSIFLVCISALIYCVALVTRDGRYILASASVLSIASIGPVLQLAT